MNTCRYCGQLTASQDGCNKCNLLADAIAEEKRQTWTRAAEDQMSAQADYYDEEGKK